MLAWLNVLSVVTRKAPLSHLPFSSFLIGMMSQTYIMDPTDILTQVDPVTVTGRTYTQNKPAVPLAAGHQQVEV